MDTARAAHTASRETRTAASVAMRCRREECGEAVAAAEFVQQRRQAGGVGGGGGDRWRGDGGRGGCGCGCGCGCGGGNGSAAAVGGAAGALRPSCKSTCWFHRPPLTTVHTTVAGAGAVRSASAASAASAAAVASTEAGAVSFAAAESGTALLPCRRVVDALAARARAGAAASEAVVARRTTLTLRVAGRADCARRDGCLSRTSRISREGPPSSRARCSAGPSAVRGRSDGACASHGACEGSMCALAGRCVGASDAPAVPPPPPLVRKHAGGTWGDWAG